MNFFKRLDSYEDYLKKNPIHERPQCSANIQGSQGPPFTLQQSKITNDMHQSIPTRLPSGKNARHCTHFAGPLMVTGGGAAKDATAKVRRLKQRNSTERLSVADTDWQVPG